MRFRDMTAINLRCCTLFKDHRDSKVDRSVREVIAGNSIGGEEMAIASNVRRNHWMRILNRLIELWR